MTIWGPVMKPGNWGGIPPQSAQRILYDGIVKAVISDGIYTVDLKDGTRLTRITGPLGLSIGDPIVLQKGAGGDYVILTSGSGTEAEILTVWV